MLQIIGTTDSRSERVSTTPPALREGFIWSVGAGHALRSLESIQGHKISPEAYINTRQFNLSPLLTCSAALGEAS